MWDLSNDTKKHTTKSRETIPLRQSKRWHFWLCIVIILSFSYVEYNWKKQNRESQDFLSFLDIWKTLIYLVGKGVIDFNILSRKRFTNWKGNWKGKSKGDTERYCTVRRKGKEMAVANQQKGLVKDQENDDELFSKTRWKIFIFSCLYSIVYFHTDKIGKT
jgi:hypothetical protein